MFYDFLNNFDFKVFLNGDFLQVPCISENNNTKVNTCNWCKFVRVQGLKKLVVEIITIILFKDLN